MATLSLALLAAAIAGFCFKTTHGIGIACMFVLILLYPATFLAFVVVGGVAFYFIRNH